MAEIADILKQWQPPTPEEEALQAPSFGAEGGPLGAVLEPESLLSGGNPFAHLSPLGMAVAGWMTRTQAAKMLGPGAAKYLKPIPSAAFERMIPQNIKVLPRKIVNKLAEKLGARQSAFTEGMMLTPEQYTPEILSQFRLPFAKQLRRGEPVMVLAKDTSRPTAQIAAHESTHEVRARLKYPYNEKTRGIEEMAAEVGEILSEFTPAEREALQDISKDPTGGVLQSFAELLEKTKVPLSEHVVPGASHPLALETKTTGVRKSMQKHLKYGPVKKPSIPKTIEDEAADIHAGKTHTRANFEQIKGLREDLAEQKAAKEAQKKIASLLDNVNKEGPLSALYGEKSTPLDSATTEAIKKLFRGEQ